MRTVIAGGGMVGLTLARLLRAYGEQPRVLERMPAGVYQRRPFLLGFQGFPTLEELGLLERVRAGGRDIAPGADGVPVAVCIEVGKLLATIGEGVPVEHECAVTGLVRDAAGRVTGVVADGPGGTEEIAADLVVACDGMNSPVRAMAGLEAQVQALADATLTWMSPVVMADRSFGMRYLSDGGQMGLMGWPEGSAGWRTIDRVGREAAMAPGVEAFRASFAALMPEAAEALEGVTSTDQLLYQEPAVLRAARWWAPGVVLIGDAAHCFGPETGVGAGLGLGDAHALARAIAGNRDDPDAACELYETWRAPVIRPYEAADPAAGRMSVPNVERPPEERWPPVAVD
jgi:2-polyprenyl-6-methoxyphenol hydroxylase-like FAD-dependent oxidoreductase